MRPKLTQFPLEFNSLYMNVDKMNTAKIFNKTMIRFLTSTRTINNQNVRMWVYIKNNNFFLRVFLWTHGLNNKLKTLERDKRNQNKRENYFPNSLSKITEVIIHLWGRNNLKFHKRGLKNFPTGQDTKRAVCLHFAFTFATSGCSSFHWPFKRPF